MTIASVLLLAVTALIVGSLIGSVGVGGVLLPPALLYIGGLELHLAMATSMWSFLFTGIVGTVTHSKRGSIDRRTVLWLTAGVVPTAVLGALTNTALPVGVLTAILGVLIVTVGFDTILRRPTGDRHLHSLSALLLLSLGIIVGFGSAVTGTGGPVLLMPTLIFLRISVLTAVGTSQAIQIPVAAFAVVGYTLHGDVDFVLGTVLGLIQVIGVVIGTCVAHALPLSLLRKMVSITCVGTGLLMLVRTI